MSLASSGSPPEEDARLSHSRAPSPPTRRDRRSRASTGESSATPAGQLGMLRRPAGLGLTQAACALHQHAAGAGVGGGGGRSGGGRRGGAASSSHDRHHQAEEEFARKERPSSHLKRLAFAFGKREYKIKEETGRRSGGKK